jgi:molybdopterin biosynthesis enzyme MoaB
MVIRTGILCVPELDAVATQAVRQLLHESVAGVVVVQESAATSQRNWIEDVLMRWCDEEELDLVLTIGGTLPAAGPSQREVVPEATLAVLDRLLPGLPEAMRAYAQEQTALALLDRSVAGIRSRTLVINLPAGATAARLFLEAVIDVIEPALAHVREALDTPGLGDELAEFDAGASATPLSGIGERAGRPKLDVEEFAAFLKRQSGEQEE